MTSSLHAVKAVLRLFFVLSVTGGTAVCYGAVEPAAPVFFSYAWPIGPETPRDFTRIDMPVITVIDAGPDSVSQPSSIRKSYDPKILDRWRREGKLLVRRCYDRKFGPDGKRFEVTPASELLEMWSHALREPGMDGIAIDEFIKDDPERVGIWAAALKEIRNRFPDKLIFCWIAGKGLNPAAAPLHRAIMEYADFCMPEIYYRESAAKGFPDFRFARFNEAVNALERSAPGISSKILMGLGVHESLYNDDPAIDYGVFLEAQIRYITNDPVLSRLSGLAFYAPMKLSQEHIELLDRLVRKYYRIDPGRGGRVKRIPGPGVQ